MKHRSLPLGIDIGATRLRVAVATGGPDGISVRSIITRDIPAGSASSGDIPEPDYVAALLADAIEDADTRERRCVSSVGEPQAFLCAMRLPNRSRVELERAAVREAQRQIGYAISDALVRIHPVSNQDHLFAIGVVKKGVLQSRLRTLRKAGLKVVAFDHEALALRRAFPNYGAVVDIGHERSSVHFYGDVVPQTVQYLSGGAEITRAIERDLFLDNTTAEKRKRTLGTLGAGEPSRLALIHELVRLFDAMDKSNFQFDRVGLVGNGSRLDGIAAELEGRIGMPVDAAMSQIVSDRACRRDMNIGSAADWALAIGLCQWGREPSHDFV